MLSKSRTQIDCSTYWCNLESSTHTDPCDLEIQTEASSNRGDILVHVISSINNQELTCLIFFSSCYLHLILCSTTVHVSLKESIRLSHLTQQESNHEFVCHLYDAIEDKDLW